MRLLTIIIAVCLLGPGACSSKDDKKPVAEPKAEEVYNDAMDAVEKKQYKSAVEKFEKLEREYPFSPWATRGQVIAAFTYYKQDQYDDAINTIDRYVKLHPGHEDVPYAYYLKALSYYEQIADVRRDQEMTLRAKAALREVVARFPESDYATDAQLKLDLVEDHLAGKELEIGRYYLSRGNTLAAINRYKNVVEHYETTSHIPEALHRLVEAYVTLGIMGEAQKYAAVLGYNYPDSKWYKYSYDLLKGNVPQTVRAKEAEEEAGKEGSIVTRTLKKLGME